MRIIKERISAGIGNGLDISSKRTSHKQMLKLVIAYRKRWKYHKLKWEKKSRILRVKSCVQSWSY